MLAVRDQLDAFPANTEVVVATFTTPQSLTGYVADHALPFAVLTDPDRVAYERFGLRRGSVARVWGLRAGRRYLEILRSGGVTALNRLGRLSEDTLQLGGDFVIGADGTLVYGFWGEGPDDRPPVADLIAAAVRGADPHGDGCGHL